MREFLIANSFLPIILLILAGCATGICVLTAKQNGGKLSQEDAQYAWGCLIHIGQAIFALALILSVTKIANSKLPQYIFASEARMLGAALFIVIAGTLWIILFTKVLPRWPLYRKMRYIHHWHFSRSRYGAAYHTPKWARRDTDKGKKDS